MSYLSLEEAAAKLGISPDRLVELRSEGQVRGFRDGASWKFPDTEIDRLAEELAADGAGSGMLVNEAGIGGDVGSIGSIIGGDGASDGEGSDVGIGGEAVKEGSTGSDVNLVAKEDGSDLELVPSSESGIEMEVDGLQEIDSADLQLEEPPIIDEMEDSIDVAIDPKEGSTGPVARRDIEAASGEVDSIDSVDSVDSLDVPGDDMSFSNQLAEDDSDDMVLGEESDDSLDLDSLSDAGLKVEATSASSLEMMNELDSPESTDKPLKSSGADVLSELDLLNAEKQGSGSGLISGDSENLLTSSGLGSGLGSSVLSEADDALDASDDLVIADDDADLMLDSVSDISVAGDSGINLMSPSDSGLSLESEPLDLAGSSLSALDLGAELADGGSGASGVGGSRVESGGEVTDLSADEEFQLSPSGVGLDADLESSSQVIEVEDSEVAEAVDFQEDFGGDAFDDGGFAEPADVAVDAFEEAPAAAIEADPMAGDAVMAMEEEAEPAPVGVMPGAIGYEVPFSLMQCLSLMFIILTLALGGMLMTDLVRNMWAYNELSAPVSTLTDSLISLMGWDS